MRFMFDGREYFGPRGANGPDGNPIGTVISYIGLTAPDDYLICDGAIYNISDYPQLAKFFNQQFGSSNNFGGDGVTTFAVPDLRNLFLRGYHGEAEEQLSGCIGEKQDGTESLGLVLGGNSTVPSISLISPQINNYRPMNNIDKVVETSNYFGVISCGGIGNVSDFVNDGVNNSSIYTSRPVNAAVLYCIKATISVPAEDVYSTDEQVVGRWIDGKPIYRRVLIGKTPNNLTNISTPGGYVVENIPYISLIRAYGTIYGTGNINYGVPNNRVNIGLTSDYNVCVSSDSSTYSDKDFVLIIEYTKTTD